MNQTHSSDTFTPCLPLSRKGKAIALLLRLSALFLLCFTSMGSAFAQAPEIGGLLPSGGLRGQTTVVRISGKNLKGARLHLSGSGISVLPLEVSPSGEEITAQFVVDPNALLGPHEVRITTPQGVSNGSRFWVDLYPNHVLKKPMQEGDAPLALNELAPVVVNGCILTRAGRDRFTINAKEGDTWVFDCFADRIRSRFDPVLELTDEAGVSVRLVQSTWESDPRFCHRFKKAGRYLLTVRDSEYNGGTNYTYRLLVGQLPYVSHFSPLGGSPGSQVELALSGIGIDSKRVALSIPKDAPLGTYWAEVFPTVGKPVLVPLLVSQERVLDYPRARGVYPIPNLPLTVDGTFFDTPEARFSFHATAQTRYLLDLQGRRIGSRIDGEIRVLNREGKEIASNDDAPGLGKEARLEFTAPASEDYVLVVRNVEEVVGENCFYRLCVQKIEPDFQLSIATDRLTVAQKGGTTLPVTVERTGGFTGAVEIFVEGLPAGVSASPLTIPADKPSADLKITASGEAPITASAIHVRGKATIGKRVVIREAPAWERYEHRSIDLVLSVEYSYTRPHHLWEMFLLAVTPAAPSPK